MGRGMTRDRTASSREEAVVIATILRLFNPD